MGPRTLVEIQVGLPLFLFSFALFSEAWIYVQMTAGGRPNNIELVFCEHQCPAEFQTIKV